MPGSHGGRRLAALRSRSLCVVLLLLCGSILQAQRTVLDDVFFHPIVTNLPRVVAITHAGDQSGRLFLTVQQGRIFVHDGERLLETPFLDIESQVNCCNENGLLNLAFHPDFTSNGLFYIFYNDQAGDIVISRFHVSADPNVADASSEKVILTLDKQADSHNGGQLQFGPDGYLYIGLGDDGVAGDNFNNGQDLTTLFGTILRVDVDRGDPFAIPDSNPFVDDPDARPEIWVYGLRNPWRFSFDRLTGDMFIGDVGQARMEEIDLVPAGTSGQNFGWRRMEGSLCFNPQENCNDGTLTLPILEDPHREQPCNGSIIGGYRYRGAESPALAGLYFYGDFCKRLLFAATDEGGTWTNFASRETGFSITTFGEDEAGEIYVSDIRSQTVFRLSTTPPAPVIRFLSPASTVSGNPAVEIGISGFNFQPDVQVEWNGQPRETKYFDENRLGVVLLADDLETAGTGRITVADPSEGGGSSSADFAIRSPPASPPAVTAAGLVDGAVFLADRPVSPGTIASLFGSGLALETEEALLPPPLPTALAGTRVLVDGTAAPQFFVSPTQINFLVPWELTGKAEASLAVEVGSQVSDALTVPLAVFSPAVFRLDDSGQGAVFLVDPLQANVVAAPQTFPLASRPARRGDFVAIWAIGLGPVTDPPASGAGAPDLPLSQTTAAPFVRIGSAPAQVLFSGLTPGFVGLYQVNAQIPQGSPSGDAVPLVLNVGGRASNVVTIAVE